MQSDREDEFYVVNESADKEVTLGPAMLTALGLGLLALCCICFLAGYVVGRRSSTSNPTAPAVSAARSAAEILAQSQAAHPAAGGAPVAASHTEPAPPVVTLSRTAAAQEPAPSPAAVAQSPQPPAPQPVAQPAVMQSAVRAALPQMASQSGAWVVQVAAVENSQDADVLVSALRRRGYSVSARHNAGDSLIHVQVGPFTSRSDADAMRQRLLNDGYNANIEQ
jgi:DedD protein